MTPHEVWFGKNPPISHLRVFGCDEFNHIPKTKRNMMENKIVKCIFIGYKDGMKGYKLWDPLLRKIVYSRDVISNEVKATSKSEEVQMDKEPDKFMFKLRREELDSDESIELDEEVEQPTLVVTRFERVRKLVERCSLSYFHYAFVLFFIDKEPKSIREAVDLIEGKFWKDTMVKEMESLHNNQTWDLVEIPNGRKIVGSKWVFNKKLNTMGQVKKFKAQLVKKGYSQVKGVDFDDIFPLLQN
jgi:hypothetical protein